MKKTTPKATETVYPIICQTVNTIPTQFVAETAKAHKVLSRTFSPKSPVAAIRCYLASKTELLMYGTAGPVETPVARPKRLYFQAVLDFGSGAMGQQTC